MQIPLEQIAVASDNLRRTPASKQADQSLEDSVRALGVLVPVLVRPEGDGYVLVAGHRRVAAARAAGLDSVPVHVMQGLVNGHAAAAQAAENMVRARMEPVDQWRAIVQLQALGYTLPSAAAALGMTERFARLLDRLGHLHEDVLAAIEKYGMPHEHDLRTIAMATPAAQKKAMKGAVQGDEVRWWRVSGALRNDRISKQAAIFDTDKVKIAWDEDLFAEPGSAEQFTTAETAKFMAAQRAALEDQVAARQAAKERVQIAELQRGYDVKLPPGWIAIRRLNPEDRPRTKTTEALFVALKSDGSILQVLALDTKAERTREKEAQKKKAAKAKDEAPAADDAEAEADAGDDTDQAPIAAAPKPPLTKAGVAFMQDAKTQALRAALRSEATHQRSHEDMLRLLILALGAANVAVSNPDNGWNNRHFEDIAAKLLLPGGGIDSSTGPLLPALAGELLARILRVPGSGAAAEWIGAAIGADAHLPRFDTPAFLEHVNGDELRRAATAEEIKPPARVSAMREQLAGKLDHWTPAAFGAPPPMPDEDEPPADYADDGDDAP